MAKGVFEGIKVADFAWVAAGPQVGRELAEHGATVVRVESHRAPDILRLSPPFKDGIVGIDRSAFGMECHTNKYGMSLDLSKPKGREIGLKMALWADIVSDGMVPGTMKKWGLDYETLSKHKPAGAVRPLRPSRHLWLGRGRHVRLLPSLWLAR